MAKSDEPAGQGIQMTALSAWLINVVVLGGISSYKETFGHIESSDEHESTTYYVLHRYLNGNRGDIVTCLPFPSPPPLLPPPPPLEPAPASPPSTPPGVPPLEPAPAWPPDTPLSPPPNAGSGPADPPPPQRPPPLEEPPLPWLPPLPPPPSEPLVCHYTLSVNPSLHWSKWASILSMVCGLACIILLRLMYEELIAPKHHRLAYTSLQYLLVGSCVFTSFAFMVDVPFVAWFKWWPWIVNWVGFVLYLNTFRRVTIDKYRVYGIWWFW